MKRIKLIIWFTGAIMAIAALIPAKASAQYYEIANQIPNLLSPMLSGSMNYRGTVEASYLKGVGDNQADFLDFSTVQGFQYKSWFFMGVGLGVDVMFSHPNDNWGEDWNNGSYLEHGITTTSVMIPLFTDFRFNIGNKFNSKPSFFIDLRLGATFLVGKDYVKINDGYLTNSEAFYLRPTMGVRIPVNKEKPKQAVNLGVSYQLITSDYWNGWNNDVTLNSLGVTASFEW
ncbi:MAG: hypothetical protein J6C81_05145 [Muribaculaceae bacterium]|nr:hypothetical protein [Muribaculaceae bacterium]